MQLTEDAKQQSGTSPINIKKPLATPDASTSEDEKLGITRFGNKRQCLIQSFDSLCVYLMLFCVVIDVIFYLHCFIYHSKLCINTVSF